MANITKNPNVRKTLPTFMYTNVIDIPLVRSSGRWEKGRWKEDTLPVEISIEGNVQPVKFQEIMQMKESDRSREWIKVYTKAHIVTAEESDITGHPADVIIYEGHSYKVMREKHYSMGVLDHKCVYAAKEPESAL